MFTILSENVVYVIEPDLSFENVFSYDLESDIIVDLRQANSDVTKYRSVSQYFRFDNRRYADDFG